MLDIKTHILTTDEWKNNFANGVNQAQAGAAARFPDGMGPEMLNGVVAYCLFDKKYWFVMIGDVQRNNARFRLLTPNEKESRRVSAPLEKTHMKDLRIIGKIDRQQQFHSS